MTENITDVTLKITLGRIEPSVIDVEIRTVNDKLAQVSHRISSLSSVLDRLQDEDTRAQYQADLLQAIDRQAELFTSRRPLNDEFVDRGGWTRYWIVTNGNGHVHRSQSCSTCRPTTDFYWLAELSGMTHTKLVELSGERACTVCFPSAPVEARNRPTSIFTPAELERQERTAERERKALLKKAKEITTPNGQPLRDSLGLIIKTEVTAQREYIQSAAEAIVWDPANGEGPYGKRPEHVPADEWTNRQQRTAEEAGDHAQRLVEALAAKRRTTVHEQRAALEPKVRAYIKKNFS
jgi:hypothetical protein